MQPHIQRELVNRLLTAATLYHGTQQMRAVMSRLVQEALEGGKNWTL